MRIAVAMSGGVDSSVAAALLKKSGHEVFGLSMRLWSRSRSAERGERARGCCSPEDLGDAARVARTIGIPHYVLDMEEVFEERVVTPFVRDYQNGRTPNPCIVCNQRIKFEVLLDRARALGADRLATGHYARVVADEHGRVGGFRLLKGMDPEKDQSYFLYGMTQEQLSRTLFPVGAVTKGEVRRMAREMGLPVADKRESQEICFLEDEPLGRFMEKRSGSCVPGPGHVLDESSAIVGQHKGIHGYTVGQRRGTGVAGGSPLYVLEIRVATNEIVVGPSDRLASRTAVIRDLSWVSGGAPRGIVNGLKARIRYRHPEVACGFELSGANEARVRFETPERAVAPGQALVFYHGEEVLGGGWIESASRAPI